ncbi:MAG: hypothetical protein K6F46_10010 [Desulfovibrio sp.]|nr:hypothetical protein [Desulfovibrio sp.]
MSEYRMIAEYWGCRENAPTALIEEEFKAALTMKDIVEVPMESTDESFAIMAPGVNAPTRDAMLEMWR